MQLENFNRQILLSEIGIDGQLKLFKAKILVIGMGGLGCPVAQSLVAAGIGTIGIVDYDIIEASNLHRQMLYYSDDVGKRKIDVAKKRLQKINSDVRIIAHYLKICTENILQLIDNYDIVIDCTDNFNTKYCINDACYLTNKTLIYGSVSQFSGQIAVFFVNSDDKINYRDIFPKQPSESEICNCNELGVMGTSCQIIGNFQAMEAIKIVLGNESVLNNKLLIYNTMNYNQNVIDLQKNPNSTIFQPQSIKSFLNHNYQSNKNLNRQFEIDINELNNYSLDEIQIIDIRELDEIPIINNDIVKKIPQNILDNDTLNSNDKVKIIVCQSGKRSFEFVKNNYQKTNRKMLSLYGGINELIHYFDGK